jgi:hypothetical protein
MQISTPLRRLADRSRQQATRILVVLVGLGMIVLGAKVPGTKQSAVTVLIVLGSGLFVTGALLPRYKDIDIGLKGFRLSQGDRGDPTPWLRAEASVLGRVAEMVLPDPKVAARIVEETLAAIEYSRTPIPLEDWDLITFRTLVSFLQRANEEVWLAGSSGGLEPANAFEALTLIDFRDRLPYALRAVGLQDHDIAEILKRSQEDIEASTDRTREAIEPYVDDHRGGIDA